MFKKTKLVTALIGTIAISASHNSQADNIADIYQLALKNDPSILAAEANLKIGELQKMSGLAGLLPQVSGGGSYGLGGKSHSTINSNSSTDNSHSGAQTYNIELNQTLFNVNSWFQFKTGGLRSEQAKAQFAADQQDLIIRVTDAYLAILLANDTLNTSRAQEKALKRQLEQVKERFAVGLVAITDVHEAQASFDNAVAETISALGNFAVSFEALEVLTGRSHFELSGLKDDMPVSQPDPINQEDWVNFALNNNFTLKTAELNRDASIETEKSGKYNYSPTVTLSAGYNSNRNPGSDRYETGTILGHGYDSTIRFSVPIYNGGGLIAERRTAAQAMILAQENYVLAKRNTVQATRSAFFAVRTTAAQVTARKQAVISAQSALESTQAGYEVGTRNIVDVLLAQSQLFENQLLYFNTRYNYVLSSLSLKQQAGQLNPDDIYALNELLEETPTIEKGF